MPVSLDSSDMIARTSRTADHRNDGFIVVAVLWMLGALATLAVIYSLYVKQTAGAFLDHNERLQAQALAMSGIELAVYRLTERPGPHPSSGRFGFRQGSAAVGVTFTAENGRVDLNFGAKNLLAGLFTALGANSDTAAKFADRIDAWRTPVAPGATDTETPLYQSAGKTYGPRHAQFQSTDEIGLVTGMPPAFVDRALPYLTVYSGHGEINVLSAAPAVIAALPGMTPDRLQLLLGASAASQNDIRAQLGPTAQFVTTEPSAANRVTVDMQFSSGRHIQAQAVVLIAAKDTEPYRILSWRDEELAANVSGGSAGSP
jgi:general secretion pathway protein K